MNWSKASAIAEILGSIAIVVTLIYLAIQTQQNTAVMQANSRDAVLQADLQDLYNLVDKPDLWLLYVKPDLTDQEGVQLFHYLAALVRIRERDWAQVQSGALDESTWEAYERPMLLTLSYTQTRKWWDATYEWGLFGHAFADYVNEALVDYPIQSEADVPRVFD